MGGQVCNSLICPWCDEPVLPADPVFSFLEEEGKSVPHHVEYALRMIIGSAAHQLKECQCYGGAREDPPNMTPRQAAILARDTARMLADSRMRE